MGYSVILIAPITHSVNLKILFRLLFLLRLQLLISFIQSLVFKNSRLTRMLNVFRFLRYSIQIVAKKYRHTKRIRWNWELNQH